MKESEHKYTLTLTSYELAVLEGLAYYAQTTADNAAAGTPLESLKDYYISTSDKARNMLAILEKRAKPAPDMEV